MSAQIKRDRIDNKERVRDGGDTTDTKKKDDDNGDDFKKRFFFNPNVGLSLGRGNTSIQLHPSVGYFFTNRFAAGAGIGYDYYRMIYYFSNNQSFTDEGSRYSARIFTLYNLSLYYECC